MLVVCHSIHVEAALEHLREAGKMRRECVSLLLGKRGDSRIDVEQTIRPLQRAEIDMFHIPPEGMSQLHDVLRRHRLMVAAQIHSHPGEAFHSRADDRWAIVRHEGALSIVVPDFGFNTIREKFFDTAKLFRFSTSEQWEEVRSWDIQSCLQLI